MRIIPLAVPVLVVSTFGAMALMSAPVEDRTNSWLRDFAEAESLAAKTGRPMLIHFYADWCGPCRRMEREVLNGRALQERLEGRFVAVKVNADEHPELAARYQVDSLPTDVFVDSNGRMIEKSVGFVRPSRYLANISRIDEQIHSRSPAERANPQESHPLVSRSNRGDPLAVRHGQDRPDATETVRTERVNGGQPEHKLGLDGYCPVILRQHRRWERGHRKYAQRFHGVVYYLSSATAFVAFSHNPSAYAPRLLGCDPVILFSSDRAVRGDVRFGAYYEGELYLFDSEENRQRFQQDPARYARSRHVLRDRKFKMTRTR